MSGETFSGGKDLFPKSKEFLKNFKADPTKASVVPMSVAGYQEIGRNERHQPILQDEIGRRFHKIEQYPNDQMFLARLLKGIIPVSDVVYIREKDEFYSYEIPIERVASNVEQFEAGVNVLGWIFGDLDHYAGVNVRNRGKSHVFFDFGGFEYFWKIAGANYLEDVRNSASMARDEKWRQALKTMINRMEEQLSGEDGYVFIKSIIEDMREKGAGVPWAIRDKEKTTEDPIKVFQEEVMRRIHAVQDGLEGEYEE